MTKQQYFEFHKAFCDKLIEIAKKKNHDYTSGSDDPFANFSQVEKLGITSTEVGFLTRMMDKISRINSFVQQGHLHNESVTDSLQDLANYCILMAGYIEKKRRVISLPKSMNDMINDMRFTNRNT